MLHTLLGRELEFSKEAWHYGTVNMMERSEIHAEWEMLN